MPWQDPDVEPAPYPRQVNGKDRARRCDEWYGEDEGECNACEGLAGYYWGDLPDATDPIPCKVVAPAIDIAPEDQAPRTWPRKFAVEMRGADRWPRASPTGNASCNFTTDCSPYDASMEGKPTPPSVYGHWYAGIHGALMVDHNEGQYGGGLLRHETVYQFPSGEEGRDRAAQGLFGLENMHLSEIHVQTKEMADANDPGVMLNLVHMNWTDPSQRGMTTCPEENLDWRRFPSPPLDKDSQLGQGVCVCVPDPTGLPWFEHAYDNATYKGRVEITPPWQATGKWGPPSNKTIIADHFAKWSFHLWVDVDTKLPVMFSSPYGGIASYGNWSDPDEFWPEDFGKGWKNLPSRDVCFDPTGESETCKQFTPLPTTPTPEPSHSQEILMGIFKGLLSDTDDILSCQGDVIGGVSLLMAFQEDVKAAKIVDAISDLSAGLSKIQLAVEDCGTVSNELKTLVAELKDVSPRKALANFKVHQTEILKTLAEASESKDSGDFTTYGMKIGFALRMVIAEDSLVI